MASFLGRAFLFGGSFWELFWGERFLFGGSFWGELFSLESIQHLFLDLLQLVLHLHYDVLHFCLVALGAGGVDFASHFLCDETEFLPTP